MTQRKIVKSGNTSYILSLPIEWIRKNNLKAGEMVFVNEDKIGDLIISSRIRKQTKSNETVTIKVDGKDDESIYLELLTTYIRDPTAIIFEGKELRTKADKILNLVKSFIGLDVMEQSTGSIIVKNFFTLDVDVSPRILLKKLDFVNRSIFSLLDHFFTKGFRKEDFSELQKLYEQTDHIFILIRKCVLKLLEQPKLISTLKTNLLEVSKHRIFARCSIHISSSLFTIGKAFLFLDPHEKEIKKLKHYFSMTIKEYNSLQNAINNQTYEQVYQFLKVSKSSTNNLNDFLKSLEDPLAVQVTTSILSINRNLRDMAHESLA